MGEEPVGEEGWLVYRSSVPYGSVARKQDDQVKRNVLLLAALPSGELAAGGVDVLAAAAPDGHAHIFVHEHADEPVQGALVRRSEGRALDGVVHDEVHLARGPP